MSASVTTQPRQKKPVPRFGRRRRLPVLLASASLVLAGLLPAQGSEGTEGQRTSRFLHWPHLQVQKRHGERTLLTCDLRELFRYTPVGGLQPGVLCGWQRGTSEEDVQMVVDGGFNLGTRGDGDGLLGVRWRRRSWSLAEAGIQLHSLTDTSDQWRTERLQSSLSFALQNRPDADYYRRSGLVVFATAQPVPRLLAGAEYRLDDYSSLASLDDLWILPRDMEVVWRNPAIDAGRMSSLLLRMEWSSRPIERGRVGDVWRHVETSLVRRESPRLATRGQEPADRGAQGRWLLGSWATLEFARPALGSDERLAFTRLVSEQRLEVTSGRLRGLSLRGRLGIAWGAPSQKQEGLGGWSAVRGFGFNRYRGDRSVSGSAEYRRGRGAIFVDAGLVHEPAGWSELLSGMGARLLLWRNVQLATAWRLTTPGRQLFPSVRLQLAESW